MEPKKTQKYLKPKIGIRGNLELFVKCINEHAPEAIKEFYETVYSPFYDILDIEVCNKQIMLIKPEETTSIKPKTLSKLLSNPIDPTHQNIQTYLYIVEHRANFSEKYKSFGIKFDGWLKKYYVDCYWMRFLAAYTLYSWIISPRSNNSFELKYYDLPINLFSWVTKTPAKYKLFTSTTSHKNNLNKLRLNLLDNSFELTKNKPSLRWDFFTTDRKEYIEAWKKKATENLEEIDILSIADSNCKKELIKSIENTLTDHCNKVLNTFSSNKTLDNSYKQTEKGQPQFLSNYEVYYKEEEKINIMLTIKNHILGYKNNELTEDTKVKTFYLGEDQVNRRVRKTVKDYGLPKRPQGRPKKDSQQRNK